jgi:hypothetical protein
MHAFRLHKPVASMSALCALVLAVVALVSTAQGARATLPPGNTVAQWNKIAEDTVVGSGAFQNEGLIYMAYESAAVYNAVVAIQGGYKPLLASTLTAPPGASVDCAVVEAAYQTLHYYFSALPALVATLDADHAEALASLGGCNGDDGAGTSVGSAAANEVIYDRTTGPSPDGRMTPIATTSSFPTLTPGPGVWRLTPPFAAPQTPWVANVRPFILGSAAQFLPDPPPSLSSSEWVQAFNQIKEYGALTGSARTQEQTDIAEFWSANVIRQENRVVRDIAAAGGLDLLQTARLAAMVNVVGADAQISVMYAKYHYLFWRPVTAIDPTSVTTDGFGPVPGFDDGNLGTVEQPGWRPLLTTPNHPEYPAAHGSLTSATAEVYSTFLGTNRINLDVHGFDPCRTISATRSSTPGCGRGCTTTSQALRASFWDATSRSTTSGTPSNRPARKKLDTLSTARFGGPSRLVTEPSVRSPANPLAR